MISDPNLFSGGLNNMGCHTAGIMNEWIKMTLVSVLFLNINIIGNENCFAPVEP